MGTAGGKVYVWDVKTAALLRTLTDEKPPDGGPIGHVTALAVSPDGRYAMIASKDRSVRLWDLEE